MCYKKVTSFILIFAVTAVLVKGSCLEYGHSCWGAHGKRSGGAAAAGFSNFPPKPLHSPMGNRIDDIKLLGETTGNRADSTKPVTTFDNFDELVSSAEMAQPLVGDQRPNQVDALKLKKMLRQQLEESLKYRKGRLQQRLAATKLNTDRRDDSSEQQQQQQQPQHDRWLHLPIFNMKYNVKANAVDDLLTRPADDDDGIFYDFN